MRGHTLLEETDTPAEPPCAGCASVSARERTRGGGVVDSGLLPFTTVGHHFGKPQEGYVAAHVA